MVVLRAFVVCRPVVGIRPLTNALSASWPAFSMRPGGLGDALICHRLESTLQVVSPHSFHSEPIPL